MKTIDELGDELRAAARRADDAVRLDLSALAARRRKKTRSALQRLRLALAAELALDTVALIALGSFLAAHVTEPRFALCALVLHLVVIAQVIAVVRQLVGLRGLDLARPVVPLQRRLETLRAERIRLTKATLLVAPLLWVPLLVVALEAAFHVDAFRVLPTAWLVVNGAFGAAFVPVMLWLARRSADRIAGSPLLRRLARDLAGHNLSAAQTFLAELAEMEIETAER